MELRLKHGHLALRISFWPHSQLSHYLPTDPWRKDFTSCAWFLTFQTEQSLWFFFPLTRLLKVWSEVFFKKNQYNTLAICFEFCFWFFVFFLLHSIIIMWYFLPRASPNEFLPWPPDTWNSTSRYLFVCCQLTVLWERIESNTSQPFLP